MQMTPEARAWLDATVRRILARHTLGDAERAGVTYELMSHLHSAAEARAREAGRDEVSRTDLELAYMQAGGDEALAAAFVAPLARPQERVLFWRRLGALGVDVVLLGIVLTFVHGAISFALMPFWADGWAWSDAHDVTRGDHESWWGFMPWGYHPVAGFAGQAAIALVSGAVVLGYFTWLEGRDGRTLGKRALELRVLRADGAPLTYRDALVRNLAKLAPPLLFLDTLIMLLAFPKEKQRVSDRIAGTIVVRS